MESVLYDVISNLGLKKVQDLPYDDMVTWAYGALSLIGGLSQYERVENFPLKVEEYRAKLPKNMYEITNCSEKPFRTNKDTLTVGIEEGTIYIEYLALPIGEDGFPLIPDDESYREAITWRIAKFLSIQGVLPNPRLTPDYCDNQWQWYCGQARAEAIAPTPDQWDRLNKVYKRMVPLTNEFENNYANLDKGENLYRHDPVGSRSNQ